MLAIGIPGKQKKYCREMEGRTNCGNLYLDQIKSVRDAKNSS